MKYETKKNAILSTIGTLAHSQGFYGRLLLDLQDLGEEDMREFVNQFPNTTDPVDIILCLEQ